MAIELARAHALPKPWGVADLRPFSSTRHDGETIGEIWFERPETPASKTSLLLKLLFTSQPLSIQVHPDDPYAHSIGLPNGKTEAWYVLSAAPNAKVALGLRERLTPQQLRLAVDDGAIVNLVEWRAVSSGDTIFVPAGTIHAIGAGLVIAEIQQRSDATFRMFDFGRGRDLHIDNAIAVADAGMANRRDMPSQLSNMRTLLTSNSHFTFEKINLAPNSAWCLTAEQETWILVINGSARIDSFDVATGDAIFAQSDRVNIHVGPAGLVALVAYNDDSAVPEMLQPLDELVAIDTRPKQGLRMQNARARSATTKKNGHMETTQ